ASAGVSGTITAQSPHAPVRPAPQATGTKATATHGVAFRGSVASFVGDVAGGTAASYTASIDWGNGVTTAGQIVPTGPNTFAVRGSNTYASPGTYTVRITIHDPSGGSTTVTTTIQVVDARLWEEEDPEDVLPPEDRAREVLVRLAAPVADDAE